MLGGARPTCTWGGACRAPRGLRRPPRRILNQPRALEQFAGDVLARIGLRDERFEPRAEAIDPRFDGVFVVAELLDGERPFPAIVVASREWNLLPRRVGVARPLWLAG